MSQAKEPLCLLVTRSGVDLLGKEISDLGQRLTELEKEAVLRRFPDASLFIEGVDNIDRYVEAVHTQTSVRTGLLAQDIHRALGAFPRCWYTVEFPRDCGWRASPRRWQVPTSPAHAPAAAQRLPVICSCTAKGRDTAPWHAGIRIGRIYTGGV